MSRGVKGFDCKENSPLERCKKARDRNHRYLWAMILKEPSLEESINIRLLPSQPRHKTMIIMIPGVNTASKISQVSVYTERIAPEYNSPLSDPLDNPPLRGSDSTLNPKP